jgi:hypothetical protein
MDYALPADFWSSVVPLALAIGAVGGLVWDIGNAVRGSTTDPKTGLDNTLELPRWHKETDGTRTFNLGFLGPIAVGAIAGLLLVLLVGPTAPNAEEAAKAVVAVSAVAPEADQGGDPQAQQGGGQAAEAPPPPTAEEATTAAEENLDSTISQTQLVLLALLGGLSGWALLRTMTTRTSELLEAAIGRTAQSAGDAAAKAVEQKAVELEIKSSKAEELAAVASETFTEVATAELRTEAKGS